MFFPDKATSLAVDILNELSEELKIRPCPVVFVSFSGGPNACMYKVLQLMDGKCDQQINLDKYKLVRDRICGHIYDSSPIDFTSDIGTRFILHPTVLKISHPPRLASWIANAIASGLDSLFLNRFESQRAEYWQTLYSSISMRVPYLILCSENDDLAPCQVICNFAERLQELGGNVKLVKWDRSPHVAHYRDHPIDYKAAVTELLGKAAQVYSHKIQQSRAERMAREETQEEISDPTFNLKKAAVSPSQSSGRYALETNDHFVWPNSTDIGPVQDEALMHLHSPPTINANGVLGQILFDVCVPKNVEGWDIRSSSSSLNGPPFSSTRRNALFNPMKCIRRSRL